MISGSFGQKLVGVEQLYLLFAASAVVTLILGALVGFISRQTSIKACSAAASFAKFFYASFLKPHGRDGSQGGQQAALENFYKAQVSAHCSSLKFMRQ